MKKLILLFSATLALSMTACGPTPTSSEQISSEESSSEYSRSRRSSSSEVEHESTDFKIDDFGTLKYEAEGMNIDNWVISSANATKVVAQKEASGGYFLAAATGDTANSGTASFNIELKQASMLTMTAAYCQTSKWLSNDEDMSLTYAYVIGTTSQQIPYGSDYILRSRSSETDWYRMTYKPVNLPAGKHQVTLSVISNTQTGCPNIDYLEFKVEAPGEIPDDPVVNPSEVPDNDFHTQLQYNYINDADWHNIFNYATGTQELSLPRALELKFDDVADASKYYVQVAKGSNDFTGAVTYETTQKVYELWNAELRETYYYRAATSESGLASASVKQLTVASQGPRNLKVDGVSNFRDVGGYNSSLIKDGVVKQGLYYRCAKLDNISTTGKAEIKRLNIKLDIDMRDDYQVPSVSPATSNEHEVEILKASIASGTESTRWEGFADIYKSIFEAIANANNKPIMLHCTAGADRTGITTFFLLAVLGVSEEDIGRDYCFTNFSTQGSRDYRNEFVNWVNKTKTTYADKPTFAEQMKAHLLTKGITEDTIETIRAMFVPGYVKGQDPYVPDPLPTNGVALSETGSVKFEAENATPTAWKNSGWGSDATFVATDAEANASGGAFVTPSTGNVDANRKFEIFVRAPKDGTVKMGVAYCRGGKNTKTATIDYSYVYQYRLDGATGKFTCITENHTDSSVANWDWKVIEFTFAITAGDHTIEGYLDSNNASTNAGCPCIDYYTFAYQA